MTTGSGEPARQQERKLDLMHVDFMAPLETVKDVFQLPYSDEDAIFALHRVNKSLMIESIGEKDIQYVAHTKLVRNEEANVQEFRHRPDVQTALIDYAIEQDSEKAVTENLESTRTMFLDVPSSNRLESAYESSTQRSSDVQYALPYEAKDDHDGEYLPTSTQSSATTAISDTAADGKSVSMISALPSSIESTSANTQASMSTLSPVAPVTITGTVSSHISPHVTSRDDSYSGKVYVGDDIDAHLTHGSHYLPPPDYFMPIPRPISPAKKTIAWEFHDMTLALGSDIMTGSVST
jgi:hypothetical protein